MFRRDSGHRLQNVVVAIGKSVLKEWFDVQCWSNSYKGCIVLTLLLTCYLA